MMMGDPSLAFLRGRSLLALVQCIRPGWLRCDAIWTGDVPLRDPAALERWLADVAGVSA